MPLLVLLSRILNRLEGDGKKVEGEGESSDKDSSSLFCALLVQKKEVLLLLKREKGLPSLGKKSDLFERKVWMRRREVACCRVPSESATACQYFTSVYTQRRHIAVVVLYTLYTTTTTEA